MYLTTLLLIKIHSIDNIISDLLRNLLLITILNIFSLNACSNCNALFRTCILFHYAQTSWLLQ